MAASAYFDTIQKMYIAYFGRPADPIGLEFWAKKVDAAAGSLDAVISGFAASTESQALFGNKTSAEKVNAIYTYLFNRPAEPAGLTYWVQKLDSGEVSQAGAMYTILTNAGAGDVDAIKNKLAVANEFTKALDTTAEILGYSGANAAEVARTYLQTVNSTEASKTAALAAVNTTVANVTAAGQGASGQTFTLTNGVDNVTGTSGNDTIVGDNNTASAADQINGGAGTDTLKLYNSSGNPVLPTISGIENIYIKSSTADYDVSTISGLTSLEIDTVNVNAAARAYTLASGQSLTLTNVTDSGNSGNDVDVNAAASVTGQTIKLNGVGDTAAAGNDVEIDINGAGVATLDVVAQAASKVTLVNTGAALKTVNVSGDKDLTIAGVANATTIAITNTAKTAVTTDVAKVAVTGAAGAETVTLSHASGTAREFSVSTGAGDDKIDLGALVLAADLTDDKVTVTGGDGTDTLAMKSAMGAALSALSAANYAKKGIANTFEVLEITDQAATTDDANLTRIGSNISTVKYTAGLGDAQTLQGLASGGTIILGAAASAGTDSLTVTVKDAAAAGNNSDVLNLTLNGAHAGGTLDYGVVVAAAVENININSTSTKTTALVAADKNEVDLTIANAVNVTITGNVYADIDGAALTGNALAKIDASGNTAGVAVSVSGATQGILITGTTKADTIVGGSGADKIVAGNGDDVITGGAGNDEIDISGGGSNTIKFGATGAANGADKIVGFNVGAIAAGGDVLDVAGQLTGINTATISANLTNLTAAQAVADDSIYTVNFNAAINGKNFATTDFADLFAAAGKTFSTTAAGVQSVILVQGTDETQVYYLDSTTGASATNIDAGDVALVGTLTGVTNAMTFVNANFA